MDDVRMVMGVFRVPLTDVCHFPGADVSRYRPELKLDVLTSINVGSTQTIFDLRVRGATIPEDITALVAPDAWVMSAKMVYSSPVMAVVRVHQPKSPLTSILDETGMPVRFPLRMDMGNLEVLVLGSRAALAGLLEQLKDLSLGATLCSMRSYYPQRLMDTLTPSQRQVLKVAASSGYWENPRRTTVEELSRVLQLSTTVLAESLSQIEKHVSRGLLAGGRVEDPVLQGFTPVQ